MSVIEIVIGQSKYKIECEADQKAELVKLAAQLNSKVNEISRSLPSIDEKTILVISALMIQSDFEDLKKDTAQKSPTQQDDSNKDEIYDALSKKTQNVCQQIDELANKILNY